MAMLSIRDESTGQIKPWVWVAGAGFAIGGAALFLSSSGGSGDTVAPSTSEGLGTGSGLDSLDAALQALLQNLDPGSTGGGGTGGGGSGGGGTGGTGGGTGQVTTGGQTVKGVPSQTTTISPRPTPTTGTVGGTLPPGTINTRPIPTASTAVTGLPIGGTSTGRTAVSTGSINVYPVSKQVNPGPPESVRRNPVAADI